MEVLNRWCSKVREKVATKNWDILCELTQIFIHDKRRHPFIVLLPLQGNPFLTVKLW